MYRKVCKYITKRPFYEWTFVIIIGVSFLAWLFLIFSEGPAGRQFDVFFQRCVDFLADALNVTGYTSQRDVYHNTMYQGLGEKAYPPLTYVFMYFMSRLVDMEKYWQMNDFRSMYTEPQFLIIYMILSTAVVVMVYELVRSCKEGSKLIRICTAAAVLLSAPMLYSFERGNTIILTMFFVMIYLFYYDSEKRCLKEAALISLAVATSLKMTPALLGVLLLYNRQWKEAIRVVIYGAVIFVVPFFFFEGGLSNIPQMFDNMQMNLENYTSEEGCTLLASVLSMKETADEYVRDGMQILTWVVSIGLLALAPFFEKRWEKLMAVSMVLIILPSHSGYYCILYLIPAMIAYLNDEEHEKADLILLLAILLIMYAVQSEIGNRILNYHLSILVICGFLLVRGGIQAGKRILKVDSK